MKKLKSLSGLLTGIFLLGNVASAPAFELPKRLQNYENKCKCITPERKRLGIGNISSDGTYKNFIDLQLLVYSFDKCGRSQDVVEGYKEDSNTSFIYDMPFIYGFDFNHNHKIEEKELFYDPSGDGLKGKLVPIKYLLGV